MQQKIVYAGVESVSFQKASNHLAELADLGIDHAMVSPRRPWDEATIDWLAAMVPDVHAIPAVA